jgi:A/G-specific adenine glycosylase
VFAFGQRWPILDGNVKRVLARCFGVDGYPGSKPVADRLWLLAEQLLPHRNVAAYTQGLMDLGALVCVRSQPGCVACPLAQQCIARSEGRTDQLPAPRPRKQRPQRTTVMLVIESDGEIMMEKRPSSGIWGGLWSFPEIDEAAAAEQVCRLKFGGEAMTVSRLATIEHGFTHFSLRIVPLLCRVQRRGLQAQLPGRVWVRADEAMHYPIPVPVRKLVLQLGTRSGTLQTGPVQAG